MNLHGEREITAWLRDYSSPGLRSIWVRLVPRGKVPDGLDTWQIPECHVDFDEEGQPTGIQLFLFKDTPRAKEPKDIIIQGLRAALDLAIEAEGDMRKHAESTARLIGEKHWPSISGGSVHCSCGWDGTTDSLGCVPGDSAWTRTVWTVHLLELATGSDNGGRPG